MKEKNEADKVIDEIFENLEEFGFFKLLMLWIVFLFLFFITSSVILLIIGGIFAIVLLLLLASIPFRMYTWFKNVW